MPLWGNKDFANNKPLFPELRLVEPVALLQTRNATSAGANTILFAQINGANSIPSTIAVGDYVYTTDGNLSRFSDGTLIDPFEYAFYRSNNTVAAIDSANSKIRLANAAIGTIVSGANVWFGTPVVYNEPNANNGFDNTILVTAGRIANTQGTTFGGGSDVSNTQIGNINVGWNKIVYKVNNDGTKRFLKETLVALADPTAANVSSANTSSNAVFGGL
jgi:hypothetical protein